VPLERTDLKEVLDINRHRVRDARVGLYAWESSSARTARHGR
jgi:hypothetical protein